MSSLCLFIRLLIIHGLLLIALFCPGKEAALGIIVVSLPCTAYLYGAFIKLYDAALKITAGIIVLPYP